MTTRLKLAAFVNSIGARLSSLLCAASLSVNLVFACSCRLPLPLLSIPAPAFCARKPATPDKKHSIINSKKSRLRFLLLTTGARPVLSVSLIVRLQACSGSSVGLRRQILLRFVPEIQREEAVTLLRSGEND
jgi:hypothetical protein